MFHFGCLRHLQLSLVLSPLYEIIFIFIFILAIDKTIAQGMDPEYAARQILNCVEYNHPDRVLAPFTNHAAIAIRTLCPNLYFKIMAIRAGGQRKGEVLVNK